MGLKNIRLESFIWLFCILLQFYILRNFLFAGLTTANHDVFHWALPAFKLFSENIAQGSFPLWNPFSQAGVPFYPIVLGMTLMGPQFVIGSWFGQFFTQDTILVFNWIFYFELIFLGVSIYIFLRRLAINIFPLVLLIPPLVFSGTFISSFRANGIIETFIWSPIIYHFLIKIFLEEDLRWRNWIMVSIFVGLYWQSYHIISASLQFLFFFLGLILFHRKNLIYAFKKKRTLIKLLLSSVIVTLMAMPVFVVFLDKNDFVFPVRMNEKSKNNISDSSLTSTYDHVRKTGAVARVGDFVHMVSPVGHHQSAQDKKFWGSLSEANMYIGMWTFFIALLGIFKGRHKI